MLAGYPAQAISAAVAAAPPASISAGPRRPRSDPCAQAKPSPKSRMCGTNLMKSSLSRGPASQCPGPARR
jgi:hypothetical protein